MPNFCMVVNCGSNGLRDKEGFYRIPSVYDNNKKENDLAKERRNAWITSLRRTDLSDTKLKYGRICSKHFISGKPARLFEKDNPDWVPSVNMGYQSTQSRKGSTGDRYEGLTKIKALCSSPQRAKRNNAKKRKVEPALVEKTDLVNQDSVESCGITNKAATNQREKKPPTAKEKLRSASKPNLKSDDFDPLDLNNLLLSTTSIFQGMCKELELSTMMNQHVDYLNLDKERITLTTSAGNSEQSLQIVIVNKNPEDAIPSFSESTDDLERMLTDVESTVMSAEKEYEETLNTKTMSTQTDNRYLEMENKKLKLEIAMLKKRILCLQNKMQKQDVPKLLVVCDDE